MSGVAIAIGPLAGGALVDSAGWRWIFLLNVPICAGLVAAAVFRLRETRDPLAAPTDWPGVATFSAASFLVVYALIRGNAEGWGSPVIVAALAAGGLLAVAFVVIERGRAHPVLDPRLFRIPAFSGTALVAFAQSFAIYPLFLFLALYLQEVDGATPLEAGVRLLPVTGALLLVAPLSGRLTGSVPLRYPLAAGLALIGVGVLLMRAVAPDSDWTALLPGFIVGGIGMGVISPALAAAMVSVVSPERTGFASGVNNTFRQLGIAVGIGALGAVFRGEEDFVAGLDSVFLVAGLVALAAVPFALTLSVRPRRNLAPAVEEGRRETEKERLDRNLNELLGELRVIMPGVQVLFAFLLVVPFNQRFGQITPFERDVYYVTLVATAISTAFLMAPGAIHRIEFRADDKEWIVFTGNRLAVIGFAILGVAVTSAVLFVLHFVYNETLAIVTTIVTGLLIAALWFAVPYARKRSTS